METYRITNLRGLKDRTGNRAKQMTKQASAPKLHAPKMSKRSHRLTRKCNHPSAWPWLAGGRDTDAAAPPPNKPVCSHGRSRLGKQAEGCASCRGRDRDFELEPQLNGDVHEDEMTHALPSLPPPPF